MNDMRIIISDIDPKTGKGSFHAEFLFLSADTPSQVEGWRSLELTGAYVNEAPLLSQYAFLMIHSRTGRFPKIERDSKGEITLRPTWSGTIFDANPPDIESWFYNYFENPTYPDNTEIECSGCRADYFIAEHKGRCPHCGTKFMELFHQPGGLSPEAENLRWLDGGRSYYTGLMIGQDPEWIKANIHGEYAATYQGVPVYHNFLHSRHVYEGEEQLKPLRGIPLVVGVDFGGDCSAAITQMSPYGRMTIFREIITKLYIEDFAIQFLKPILQTEYGQYEIVLVIDPTGKDKGTVGISPEKILKSMGFTVELAPSNDPNIRINAVDSFLTKNVGQGSGLLIDKSCKTIIKGMAGGYIIGTNGKPKKDGDAGFYSHSQDTVQYAALRHQNFRYQPKKSNIIIPPNFSGGGVRSGAY